MNADGFTELNHGRQILRVDTNVALPRGCQVVFDNVVNVYPEERQQRFGHVLGVAGGSSDWVSGCRHLHLVSHVGFLSQVALPQFTPIRHGGENKNAQPLRSAFFFPHVRKGVRVSVIIWVLYIIGIPPNT